MKPAQFCGDLHKISNVVKKQIPQIQIQQQNPSTPQQQRQKTHMNTILRIHSHHHQKNLTDESRQSVFIPAIHLASLIKYHSSDSFFAL